MLHRKTGLIWLLVLMFFCFFAASSSVLAFCFNEAGVKYQIDPKLLKAIARKESALNPSAINANRDKSGKITSFDYGLMQINSIHLATLKNNGIIHDEKDLLANACLNVQIGAWILARHFRQCGVQWACLGSYNAGFKDKNAAIRMAYARAVYRLYQAELGLHEATMNARR